MSRSNVPLRRAIPAAMFVIAGLLAPGGAAAQTIDPSVLASGYASGNTYAVDQSTGLLRFGDGAAAQSLPTGDMASAAYATGAGAAGNLTWGWWPASFGCLILGC